MNDLVERLRARWESRPGAAMTKINRLLSECREAADEIERLTAALSHADHGGVVNNTGVIAACKALGHEGIYVSGATLKRAMSAYLAALTQAPAQFLPTEDGEFNGNELDQSQSYPQDVTVNDLDTARKWLAARWCIDHPNEGHVKQLAEYAASFRTQAPAPTLTGEVETPAPVSNVMGEILSRWREGQFETTADEAAQAALDQQAVGLDVATIIEAWLAALARTERYDV